MTVACNCQACKNLFAHILAIVQARGFQSTLAAAFEKPSSKHLVHNFQGASNPGVVLPALQ